ncbi:hypothetical protein DFH11DRAFT_1645165 [Phellopilus nigrolimitatus]|nr:hypothetical protein DFH11DRAFT_1645165 [Phellopilus nigrolimitatus]
MIEVEEEDFSANGESNNLRANALYLHGTPISHLPTGHIFAYARHYSTEPEGLEWVDDTTCVLIFATKAACRAALDALRKSPTEVPDFDDCVAAKPIPVTMWPPEARINKTLGMSAGLEGMLLTRIARTDDRKVRGAKDRSVFYRKHGEGAGKDPNAHAIGRVPDPDEGASWKRRKVGERAVDEDEKRRELDDELDTFLQEDFNEERSPSPPPSKMRSDYIDSARGRSLLERTSNMRAHPNDLVFEAPEPARLEGRRRRRGRERLPVKEDRPVKPLPRRRGGRGGEGVKAAERPIKTRQELDDELEAFLNEKD